MMGKVLISQQCITFRNVHHQTISIAVMQKSVTKYSSSAPFISAVQSESPFFGAG